MDDDSNLLTLFLFSVPLSLLSFGGGQAIVVGLQHQTVDIYHWLTAQEFTELFAISRAAPGPSTLIVALIGWQVAGLWGAVVAALGIFGPSSLLVCMVGRWWESNRQSRLTIAIEQGLRPIAVGLLLASTVSIAKFAALQPIDMTVVATTSAVLYFTKIGPYPVLVVVGTLYFFKSMAGF